MNELTEITETEEYTPDAEHEIDLEHSRFSMAYRKPQYPVTIMVPYVDGIRGPVVASLLFYAKHIDIGIELVGNSIISVARNELANRFLNSTADWSFWIDSDVFVPYGKADTFLSYSGAKKGHSFATHNTLLRLMSHHQPLVGGVYSGRFKGSPLTIQPDLQPRSVNDTRISQSLREGKPAGGLQPVEWVAAGLMLVHRKVFETIRAKVPWKPPFPGAYYPFFVQTDQVGEDVYFCNLAKSVGAQPLLDTEVRAGHIGLGIWMPEDSQPPIALGGVKAQPPPD
jgi:hypothetical protein